MRWIATHRVDLASCASTSDEAARLARAGARHGTVVIADTQTSGRGRLGRTWASPPGNIYISVVLRLPVPPPEVPAVTLALGIAVCDVLRAAGAPGVALKWPNDVVIVDAAGIRKIAGILVESQTRGTRLDAVIAGIGINIAAAPTDHAVALADLVSAPVERERVIAALLPTLERWIDRFVAGGATAIVPAWQARMCPGLRVRAATIEGAALGLEPDGALQIRDDTGVIHRIRSGEAEAIQLVPP